MIPMTFFKTIYRLTVSFCSVLFLLAFLSCDGGKQDKVAIRKPKINNDRQLDSVLFLLEKDSLNYELNNAVLGYFTVNNRMGEHRRFALDLFNRAIASGDTLLAVQPAASLAFPYLSEDKPDSARFFLDFVEKHASEDHQSYRQIHNAEAIYALRFRMDYPKAMHHFQKAIKYSQEHGYLISEIVLLSNMTYIYYYRNDTAGVKYSRQAYYLAKNTSNVYAQCLSLNSMAMMEMVCGNYSSSLRYARKADSLISESPEYSLYLPEIYSIMAESHYKSGNADSARIYYDKAFSNLIHNSEESVRIRLDLSYADFLLASGRPREAIDYYWQGIEMSVANYNVDYRDRLYLGLSKAYYATGMKDSAYKYSTKYHAVSDSLYNLDKENQFNQLFLDYQSLKYENELQQKELMLLKSRRAVVYAVSLSLVIIVILVITYVNYRRKDQMYTNLVRQHQDFIKKVDEMKQISQEKNNVKNRAEVEMFEKLERMMNEDHVYRQKDLSLDKLCDLLDTNKTFLSAVINKYAKMSLPNYINSYRIREAIEIISDPDKDVMLKAVYDDVGYNSKPSFYRAFQKETGCSPLVYREKVLRLKNF